MTSPKVHTLLTSRSRNYPFTQETLKNLPKTQKKKKSSQQTKTTNPRRQATRLESQDCRQQI